MTRMRNGSHAAQYLWWRVLIVASCVLAFALRRWPNVKEPTFWAEDGTTFFLGARVSGLASVVEHSSGYLHVPARLVALFADLFPAAGAPTIYTATALLAVGWTLWTVLSIAWPIGVRAAFCVAVAVVPHGGHTMHVLVNAHWWLTLGLLAVTLDRLTRSAESPSTTRRDVAWIVIAGLSGPHVLMLTPLWFWAAVRERSRASWTLLACVVAVALIQFLMLRSSWDPSLAGPPPDWEGVQRLFLGAYAAGLFAGPIDYAQHLNTCSVLAAAFWLFFLSVPLWLSGRARWFAMGAMFVVFANLAALAVRGGGSLEGLSAFGAGQRFFVIPYVATIWCLVLLARTSHVTRWVAVLMLAAIFVNAGRHFVVEPIPRNHYMDITDTNITDALDRGEATLFIVAPNWPVEVPAR